MISKGKLAELILLQKSGGDPDPSSKFDIRDIEVCIDLAISEFMDRYMTENREAILNGDWVKSYKDVEVIFDCDREEAYIDLPASVISLHKDQGVRQISYMKGQSTSFTRQNPESQSVWDALEAGSLGVNEPFYLEGNKVYFPQMGQDKEGAKLLVKVIAGADGYSMDDPMPLPTNYHMTVIQSAAAFYDNQRMIPNKMNNDHNPNTI